MEKDEIVKICLTCPDCGKNKFIRRDDLGNFCFECVNCTTLWDVEEMCATVEEEE